MLLNCSYADDFLFFFFNDTATTEIYTLSLHDALPISGRRGDPAKRAIVRRHPDTDFVGGDRGRIRRELSTRDRKSTRLNSSHSQISYAVFCLKKKTQIRTGVSQALDRVRHDASQKQTA